MPEAPGFPEALGVLRTEILSKWPDSEELAVETLRRRFPERRNLVAGWRLPGVLPEAPSDLLVAVDSRFPWSLPLISLPDATGGVTSPHVEVDGHLCLVPSLSTYTLPVGNGHVVQLVGDAVDLLKQGKAQANDGDFFAEAQSYWGLVSPSSVRAWLIKEPPLSHSLWVSAIDKESGNLVLGINKEGVSAWANEGQRRLQGTFEPALVVHLDAPLHPNDYPLTMSDLFALIEKAGASAVLYEAISRWRARRPLPVVLSFVYEGARNLLGGVLLNPRQVKMPGSRHPGIPGFRNGARGRVTARLQALSSVPNRFPHFRATEIHRGFLHLRTAGLESTKLLTSHVVIAGCGALGGQLAVQLAQAGVGRLTLIDTDELTWQNVGRHVLGGEDVGKFKSSALAKAIKRRFPDAEVASYVATWEAWAESNRRDFEKADLFISAIAEPPSNRHLDALTDSDDFPPVVFGWMEPFGAGAHAVLCFPEAGRLKDITDDRGLLLESVADVASAPGLPREPSCGAFYQPYSSLSALACVGLVGELALDALFLRVTSSVHRIWVGGAEDFSRNGLYLREVWRMRLNDLGWNRRYQLQVQRGEPT